MPLDQPTTSDPTDLIRMPMADHLDELRHRLILCLVGFLLAAVVTFIFGFDLLTWLAQPLLQVQFALGYPTQTVSFESSFGFMTVYVPVCLIAALIVASPWIVFQIWKFVAAGLYAHEKKAVYLLTPLSTLMTALAVGFGYYVMLPVAIVFFLRWTTYYPTVNVSQPGFMVNMLVDRPTPTGLGPSPGKDAKPLNPPPLQLPIRVNPPDHLAEGMVWFDRQQRQIKLYINGRTQVMALYSNRLLTPLPDLGLQVKFVAMMGLGLVIAFQLPVVMLVMGWARLVDPARIAHFRKYALFGCAVVGALLTPTDVFSMLILWIPLYGLFEVGLLLMRLAYHRGANANPRKS